MRWVPFLNFKGDPGVPLLTFEGDPGIPLLNFEEGPASWVPGPRSQRPKVLGAGVLVSLLHHASGKRST